jgi:hypothetical protein
MKYKYSKLYWFINDLKWMSVYFSPFKPIIPKLYIGKVALGTPYFFPRRFIKATPERAHKATEEYIKREESYNKMNPNYARTIKPYNEIFKEKMKCGYSEPKIIGFDFVSLGWKTKWSNTNYRFEYSPIWSVVFFGYQIALTFCPPESDHYWACWLYYTKDTDKNKTVKERIEQARGGFPCKWKTYSNGEERLICYWDILIKNKYL